MGDQSKDSRSYSSACGAWVTAGITNACTAFIAAWNWTNDAKASGGCQTEVRRRCRWVRRWMSVGQRISWAMRCGVVIAFVPSTSWMTSIARCWRSRWTSTYLQRAWCRTLERIAPERGYPLKLRLDNVLPAKASRRSGDSLPERGDARYLLSSCYPSVSSVASIFWKGRSLTIVTEGRLPLLPGLHCTQHKVSIPMEDSNIVYEVRPPLAACLNGPCERVLPPGSGIASSR